MQRLRLGVYVGVYEYDIHPTAGLTEVRSYAAFVTSFPAEGFAGSLLGDPGVEDRVGRPPFHAAAAVGPAPVSGLKILVQGPSASPRWSRARASVP